MKPISAILPSIACLPLPAAANSLQCGNRVITNGATQAEVISRCGQPGQVEPVFFGRWSFTLLLVWALFAVRDARRDCGTVRHMPSGEPSVGQPKKAP